MTAYSAAVMNFAQTFDAAGRLATVNGSLVDGTHPGTLFTARGYTPSNALADWLLGQHIALGRSFDIRTRVTGQAASQQ